MFFLICLFLCSDMRVESEWFPPYHWTKLKATAQELSRLFYGIKFIQLASPK